VGDISAQATADLTARDGYLLKYPMAVVEALLHTVHDSTGLPWWQTIALATLLGRVVLFPLQVYQSRGAARMTLIKPQLEAYSARIKAGYSKKTSAGLDDAEVARLEMQQLMDRNGVRPWSTMGSALVGMPVWVSFFFALRKMVYVDGVGLSEGGMLWFPDLTQHDPYYMLPVLSGLSLFGMVSLGDAGQAGAKPDAQQQMVKNVMRGAAVVIVPATAWFESGVFIYWLTANALAITQTLALRQPSIRSAVGMPPMPTAAAASASESGMLSAFGGEPAAAAAPPKAAPVILDEALLSATPPQAGRPRGKTAGGRGKKRSKR